MKRFEVAQVMGIIFPLIYAVIAAFAGWVALSAFYSNNFIKLFVAIVVVAASLRTLYRSMIRWRNNAKRWQ